MPASSRYAAIHDRVRPARQGLGVGQKVNRRAAILMSHPEIRRGRDGIDALLCAIQAAWAWTQRDNGFGAPRPTDPLEGWIACPTLQAP